MAILTKTDNSEVWKRPVDSKTRSLDGVFFPGRLRGQFRAQSALYPVCLLRHRRGWVLQSIHPFHERHLAHYRVHNGYADAVGHLAAGA